MTCDSATEAARRIIKADEAVDAAKPGVDYRECATVWRLACVEGGSLVARAYLESQSQAERMREALGSLFVLMDAADSALDKDTYDQSLRDDFDAPDDADYSVCAGTVRKCMAVFAAIEKMRNDSTLKQPLVLSKEWCLESAHREGDAEIGAGSPSHPLRAALTPKED